MMVATSQRVLEAQSLPSYSLSGIRLKSLEERELTKVQGRKGKSVPCFMPGQASSPGLSKKRRVDRCCLSILSWKVAGSSRCAVSDSLLELYTKGKDRHHSIPEETTVTQLALG